MSVPISTNKARKLIRLYFAGYPQPVIAKKLGISQATVSNYTTGFKRRAEVTGLISTAKELDMVNEVTSLRNLSVELYHSGLTLEEAKQGHTIIKAFQKLGISPEQHLDLVNICKKVGDTDFVKTALELSKVESQTGKNYQQLMSGFVDALHQLPQMEKKISEKRAELKSVNESISQKKKELATQEENLEKHEAELKSKICQMNKDLSEKMKNMGVTGKEVEEVVALKVKLIEKNLSIQTVIKIAEEF
jgi:hypothetical protein